MAVTGIVWGFREDIIAEYSATDHWTFSAKYYVFFVGDEDYDPICCDTIKECKANIKELMYDPELKGLPVSKLSTRRKPKPYIFR